MFWHISISNWREILQILHHWYIHASLTWRWKRRRYGHLWVGHTAWVPQSLPKPPNLGRNVLRNIWTGPNLDKSATRLEGQFSPPVKLININLTAFLCISCDELWLDKLFFAADIFYVEFLAINADDYNDTYIVVHIYVVVRTSFWQKGCIFTNMQIKQGWQSICDSHEKIPQKNVLTPEVNKLFKITNKFSK